jgi:hypothetical protein
MQRSAWRPTSSARKELEEDVEVGPRRHDLLDPDDGHQDLGEGEAHPPVALGLDDDERARLGDGEVRTRHGDPRVEELLAEMLTRSAGELRRVVGEVGGRRSTRRGHPVAEDLPDL